MKTMKVISKRNTRASTRKEAKLVKKYLTRKIKKSLAKRSCVSHITVYFLSLMMFQFFTNSIKNVEIIFFCYFSYLYSFEDI